MRGQPAGLARRPMGRTLHCVSVRPGDARAGCRLECLDHRFRSYTAFLSLSYTGLGWFSFPLLLSEVCPAGDLAATSGIGYPEESGSSERVRSGETDFASRASRAASLGDGISTRCAKCPFAPPIFPARPARRFQTASGQGVIRRQPLGIFLHFTPTLAPAPIRFALFTSSGNSDTT